MIPVNPGLFLKITGTGITFTKKRAEICRDRDPGRSLSKVSKFADDIKLGIDAANL